MQICPAQPKSPTATDPASNPDRVSTAPPASSGTFGTSRHLVPTSAEMPVTSADGVATSFSTAKPCNTAAISRDVTSGDVGVTCRDVDVPIRLNNLCMSQRPPRPTTISHSPAPPFPRIEFGAGAGQKEVLLVSAPGAG